MEVKTEGNGSSSLMEVNIFFLSTPISMFVLPEYISLLLNKLTILLGNK